MEFLERWKDLGRRFDLLLDFMFLFEPRWLDSCNYP